MKKEQSKRTKTLDWNKVHRRLDNFRKAVEQGFVQTHDEKKKILRDRAKALARETEKRETIESFIEVTEFMLAGERYGIETAHTSEVYPLKELTSLPGTPPFVLGIINVRGKILSVIDIKKFFDLPEKGITDLNKVIIVHTEKSVSNKAGEMEFGILADIVLGVRSIPLKEIQPSLPTLKGIREVYLRGVTNESIVILDVEKILSDKNIIVHEEVEA